MRELAEKIWKDGEYDYAAAYGFIPDIHGYIHEKNDAADKGGRDCIIILPGSGYCMNAPHEGAPVAMEFYNKGMNAFVLTYTTDITMSVPLKKQPMEDISRTVRYIRKNAVRFGIEGGRIIVCGFSAGAHVCGSLAVHYKDIEDPDPELNAISNRPDGVILAYPVISSGEYGHASSFEALLGRAPSKEELEYFSLEKQVSPDTPPCFLWHTATDDLVPVENSYLFADALKKNKIPFAHYVFPKGFHGLGLAKKGVDIDGIYVVDQAERAVAAVKAGKGVNVSDKRCKEFEEQFPNEGTGSCTDNPHDLSDVGRDVSIWADLADVWMSRL